MNYTAEELVAFEKEIGECFNNKLILGPIHLQDNNAKQLIEIFKSINEDDWICGTWRFHMECLLKGVPRDKLKEAILDRRSISLCFKDYRVITSAIVTGTIPIALGLAFDIKRKGQSNKVYCFVGEMSATTGSFHEALTYARNHDLPVTYVVSDNGKSVCTDTRQTWNTKWLPYEPRTNEEVAKLDHLWYYRYRLDYPHSGSGAGRIQF